MRFLDDMVMRNILIWVGHDVETVMNSRNFNFNKVVFYTVDLYYAVNSTNWNMQLHSYFHSNHSTTRLLKLLREEGII